MLTRKDLALNDEYLNALVKTSRRKDMSAFNDFAPLCESKIHTDTNIIKEYHESNSEPAFSLVTKIAFLLKCRCGFSWTYQPREYNPNRVYALCPRCRQAVKIHQNKPIVKNRKSKQ